MLQGLIFVINIHLLALLQVFRNQLMFFPILLDVINVQFWTLENLVLYFIATGNELYWSSPLYFVSKVFKGVSKYKNGSPKASST